MIAARTGLLLVLAVVFWSQIDRSCFAQDAARRDGSLIDTIEEGEWDYESSYRYEPNPKAIIHQKAQIRGMQRTARMAAMRWYGMYNERPTASPTPFTALYSPVWQMPGGRPYAWHYRGTSSVIVFKH